MKMQDRLRTDLVMSMFLNRDDLYRQMDAERKEAADIIDGLYEALDRAERILTAMSDGKDVFEGGYK